MKDCFIWRMIPVILVCILLLPLPAGNVCAEEITGRSGSEAAGSFSLPADTTIIEDYAFCNCTSLTGSLTIPDHVTGIGRYAFANCTGLTGRLTIPDSVVNIGEGAFEGCSELSGNLIIPAGVSEIGENAFEQCTKLKLFVYEGSYAHQWCESHEGVSWRLISSITAIVPEETSLIVKNGQTLTAQVSLLPAGAEAPLVWSSSDEMICTVDQEGNVFGCYPGQAVITAAAPDGLVSANIDVTVQAIYRAVRFSESTFLDGVIQRNRGDVQLMTQMLATVTGPDGGTYEVSSFDDLVASEVYEKITDLLVAPSRDGDVSMFFFASHGDANSSTEQYAGRLWCKNKQSSLELPTLSRELAKINGKVIVLLESCGPGAALITFKGTEMEDPEETDDIAFSQSVISVFEAADPGLAVCRPAVRSDAGITGKGTNLFLTDKFIVMTAAAYHQTSYSARRGTCNLFPAALTDGVGTSGSMPADVIYGNSDGKLTVQELYKYVYENTKQRQTPMVHPKNCEEVLFLRAK